MIKNCCAVLALFFAIFGCKPQSSVTIDVPFPPSPVPTPDEEGDEIAPISKKNLFYIKTDSEYQAIPNKRDAVLYFYADWCGPCQNQAPIFEEVSREFPDVMFYKINIDTCRQATQSKGVRSIPTIIIGRYKEVGLTSKDTLRMRINAELR